MCCMVATKKKKEKEKALLILVSMLNSLRKTPNRHPESSLTFSCFSVGFCHVIELKHNNNYYL